MNKNFTKSDLKTGHIVVTKGRGNAILIGDRLKSSLQLSNRGGLTNIGDYDDDLKDKTTEEYDIEKVYKITNGYDYRLDEIIDKLPAGNVELVWERKREIDWSKVPKFTRVQVRDSDDTTWQNSYFIKRDERAECLYIATVRDEFTYDGFNIYWKQIRIFDEADIKEEWYK